MSDGDRAPGLGAEAVQRYYAATHAAYLRDVGRSLQGALFKVAGEQREIESNRLLARLAGLESGQHALDAGCGFCGPSIDFAAATPGLRIVAVTLSPLHARVGRGRVAEARLEDRVRVVLGNYHDLPLAPEVFDHALFVESLGHSYDQPRVLLNVLRVLKPGGRIFVKDFFVPDRPLSEDESRAVADWDSTFQHDTQTVNTTAANLSRAGFIDVKLWDVSHLVDFETARRAMFGAAGPGAELTEYGRLHEAMTRHVCFPLRIVVLRARKPMDAVRRDAQHERSR